jgi:hypothetical protein
MKQIITTLLLLVAISSQSQVFTNSNSELCVKLYTVNDGAGEYMVYLVIEEELSTEDVALLKVWDTLPQQKKSSLTQRWSIYGRRVEVIRPPYHMYPPVFPGDLKHPVLVKRKEETIDYCPWTDSTLYNFHGNYKIIKY